MHKQTKNLNILILSWEYFPVYLGGLGFLVKSVADELTNQGANITTIIPHNYYNFDKTDNPKVVCLQTETEKYLKSDNQIEGLDFIINEIDTGNKKKQKNKKILWPSLFLSTKTGTKKYFTNLYPVKILPAMTRAKAWAVKGWLENYYESGGQKFDAIIGMDWLSIPCYYLLKKNYPKTPFLFYINSTELDRNPGSRSGNKEIIKLEKEGFNNCDGLIAISNVTKKVLVESYGVDNTKILTVFNDISFIPEPHGYGQLIKGKNLLFIGRITSQKGLQFLIDTLATLVQIDHQIKLIVAGDGEQTAQIIEMVVEKKLEKNCIFTGWVNDEEKKLLYKSSDLFLMPSPSEPFGLTALEAVRSGLPVIASINCGFIDVIPSTPTFNYHDISKLVYLILYYLNNQEQRQKLLQAQQQDLKQHSWSKEVSKLVSFINSLINTK